MRSGDRDEVGSSWSTIACASIPHNFDATCPSNLQAVTEIFGIVIAAHSNGPSTGRRHHRNDAHVRRPLFVAIAFAGAICRAAIWNGPRNTLLYGLIFQAPFFVSFLLCASLCARSARTTRDPMWLTLAITFGVMAAYFLAKPFFAAAFGSGATVRDYAASPYALFSQALGGVTIIMSGLVILLIIVRSVLDRSIEDAETDQLTGVANRRGFDRQAHRTVERALLTRQPLAVIALDLDHFKRVNDVFGHATGDAVLRAFAKTVTATAPSSALVARLGGEEFAVLLDRTTLEGAALTAEAIRKATRELGDHLPPVTVSGGIAELKEGDTVASMLHRADVRAYDAKITGRNRIHESVRQLPSGDESA